MFLNNQNTIIMDERNMNAQSEPPYSRMVLKRMEQQNDELRSMISMLTTKMDIVWGPQPGELNDAKSPKPPVGCMMDEFDLELNTQGQLLNKLNAELVRLSKFF